MKNKLLVLLPLFGLLVACNTIPTDTNNNNNQNDQQIDNDNQDSQIGGGQNQDDQQEEQRQLLPIGNYTVDGPTNKTKDDINNAGSTRGITYDLSSYLPSNWSFIVGNNKKANCTDFYSATAGGGFKFAQLYYGLQTPLITSWKKIEINMTISTVKNNSQKAKDAPILHVYGYDISGKHISTDYVQQGSITANTTNVHFYVRNEQISYLEFRLNAFPFKGSQCYNFGVSSIQLIGWQYE